MAGFAGRIDSGLIDAIEGVASVLLAVVLAHWLGATHVHWAAFSGFVVMRAVFHETLMRGGLRMVGTLVGASLAMVLVPPLARHWPETGIIAAAVVAVVVIIGLYGAITARRSYAWLLFGLTFVMLVVDKLDHPDIVMRELAKTRVLETLAGTLACVVVGAVSGLTLRRIWPGSLPKEADGAGWQPLALRHACQGGVAMALLLLVAAFEPLPALVPAAITIMTVMLVPVSVTVDHSRFKVVARRIWQRLVGALAGGAAAGTVLVLSGGQVWVLIMGTAAGVAFGRWLETRDPSRRYIGTQFALAVLVTLVPDHYADVALAPALARLSGIFVGVAALVPVLVIWHGLAPLGQILVPGRDNAHNQSGESE